MANKKVATKSMAIAKKKANSQVSKRVATKRTAEATPAAVVKRGSKDYDVKVGGTRTPKANPYLVEPSEALKILKKVGILTAKGNLSRIFK